MTEDNMRTIEFRRSAAGFVALVLIASAPAFAAPPQLRLATLAPKGTAFHRELLAMGEKWAAAPDGGAKLTVYTDGTQGGEADMVRRMRAGQLQAAMLTVTGISYIDDSVAALQNMPMIFRSTRELEYVREKMRPRLEKGLREKGFVVLFWGDAGWIRFFSKRPGTTPDEIRRMKLFTLAGNPQATDLWKLAGFQPVDLEVTNALTGLNTGLIDCVPSDPYYALAGQFYSPAPYMLDLRWAPLVGGTIMTEKAFNTLSPAVQKVMLESAAETGKKLTIESREQSDKSVETMKTKFGLHVEEVSPGLEAQWRQLAESFYPKIRGSIVPADMFDEVQKLLSEFRRTDGKPIDTASGGQ
jgi:TRAP-type C4-dicarboxylate transport system substrate-binding protein